MPWGTRNGVLRGPEDSTVWLTGQSDFILSTSVSALLTLGSARCLASPGEV